MATSSHRLPRVVTLSEGAKVTPVELFLDLVFVYGFTQVTGFMATAGDLQGVVRGMAILGLLWWLWSGFAWLGNIVQADEGPVRIALFAVMFVVFVVAVTIPESFADIPGGLWGPWVFAAGYLTGQLIHNGLQLYASRRVFGIGRSTLLLLIPHAITTALLLIAGKQQADPWLQTWLWIAALVTTYVGIFLINPKGWQLGAASHFAERHGLIMIVALGETVVAIGVGISLKPITWGIIGASALAIAVLAALWWAYFDVVALAAENVLHHVPDEQKPRLARDSYSFLHFPMIAGIIVLALGLKEVFAHLDEPLGLLGLVALYGGASLYLLAHVAFRLRNVGTLNVQRLVLAVVLLALIPAVREVPALVALLVLTVATVGLVAYEALAFASSRDRIRHGGASEQPGE